MAATAISNAAAIAACDSVVDLIDGGPAAGHLKIYTGAKPTNPDVTTSAGHTLLADFTLADPAFGNAADAAPGGRATATNPSDVSASNTGTASWFRVETSAAVAVIDGDVGTTGADLNLNTTSIQSGATVSITSWTVTMPET